MKWELRQEPEMVSVNIDPMLYKVQLEELAKILYKAFCQLDPKFKSYQFYTREIFESCGRLTKET